VASPGGTQLLSFSFFDENTGLPADPSSLRLDLTYGTEAGLTPDVGGPFTYTGASSPGPDVIYRTGLGTYAFQWGIPGSALTGVYVANWTAVYGGANWLAIENFTVTPAGAVAGLPALLPLEPDDELVCVAWLSTVPGLSPAMVATTLPADVAKDGSPAAWIQTGFVTVSVAGGNPDTYLPVNRPVMQVDVWATKPGSGKPPWYKTAAIASTIRRACWDRRAIPRPLMISAGGQPYPSAVVRSAYLATAFRRVYDDVGDYSRRSADLALDWIRVNDHLD